MYVFVAIFMQLFVALSPVYHHILLLDASTEKRQTHCSLESFAVCTSSPYCVYVVFSLFFCTQFVKRDDYGFLSISFVLTFLSIMSSSSSLLLSFLYVFFHSSLFLSERTNRSKRIYSREPKKNNRRITNQVKAKVHCEWKKRGSVGRKRAH